MKEKDVLIIVDAQKDFMPGGALAVPNGDEIVPVINDLLSKFNLVIFTLDWHPDNHKSFASQHKEKKVFDTIELNGLEQVLWPDHCIKYTEGSELHNGIDMSLIKGDFYLFKKGMNPEVDSYSGFYDNGREHSTGLLEFLNIRGIKDIYMCGLAFEYCLAYTALDAALEGFETSVIREGTKPFDPNNVDKVLQNFKYTGVKLINNL